MNPIYLPAVLHVACAIVFAPLLPGIISRTKAIFAGRQGPPLLQGYFDLAKLLRKGAVYSESTTWLFRAGPIIGLSAACVALLLVPFAGVRAIAAFPGDLILIAYLLGLMRFFTVLAALDTASSFEGMGASREVTFSALAEPALLLGLAALARRSGGFSLSEGYSAVRLFDFGPTGGLPLLLIGAALFVVYLAENARIPFDDPNTHLELTMIHEVMVLDHGGPDLALVQYAGAIKLWILGALVVGILLPIRTGHLALDFAVGLAAMGALAVATGCVESTMARLRLNRVPQLLVAATVLSALALMLVLR
ncbi:MAG: NADH-quinone oxidoreductase subunit H [Candidatus Eisenbacteria bacterium]|nr:NADH-quinone oxidoreductase subunit H [Candidatus Eisenbacteria bacterium]